MSIFRIVAFCDKKKVGDVHEVLTGLVYDMKVEVVANAEKKNGKLVAQTSGTLLDMFAAHIKKTKIQHVTPAMLRDFAVAAGRSEKSYSTLLRSAVEVGMLKRAHKSRGGYDVVQ